MTHTLVPDPSGARYKRSGAWGRAGQIKQVKQWYRDELADFGDWLLPNKCVSILLEQEGYKVRAQKLQMNIRDALLLCPETEEIELSTVDVPLVDDDELIQLYTFKRLAD